MRSQNAHQNVTFAAQLHQHGLTSWITDLPTLDGRSADVIMSGLANAPTQNVLGSSPRVGRMLVYHLRPISASTNRVLT